MIAYEKFSTLRDVDKFKSWVLSISRRERIKLIREYSKEVLLEKNNVFIEDISLLPENIILKEEINDCVIKAINALKFEYNQVIIRCYLLRR
ncbi:hypothetical protein DP129_01280 [Clostridium tetani]|uniref:sigma-70 family RNA polymerase sigma factor n=1 Tax=Clostridium tetani TaxID=1513 RepID=UPI00100BCE29|nr:sigma-70 family RNA polymerase sigma factor [Clostridium tetani]RXI41360.1 hypothetical protein DP129_01280 [Clostridium tetani]